MTKFSEGYTRSDHYRGVPVVLVNEGRKLISRTISDFDVLMRELHERIDKELPDSVSARIMEHDRANRS